MIDNTKHMRKTIINRAQRGMPRTNFSPMPFGKYHGISKMYSNINLPHTFQFIGSLICSIDLTPPSLFIISAEELD